MRRLSDLSEAYLRLEETLPQRGASTQEIFRVEPRALRAWLDGLPLANFQAATKEVLDGLRRLNAQPAEAAQRLEALESLRPTVLGLAAATEQQIVGASFPLPSSKIGLGEFALSLQEELALGYRIALVGLCAPIGTVGLLRGRTVALAGLRAVQHGQAHLAAAYLLYRVPPYDAWRVLHDVYRFVAEARLAEREVDEATARSAYVESLLMALMNPYRHTQREQADAAAFARVLAPYAELSELRGEHDVPVQTGNDLGPGYLAEERVSTVPGAPFLRLERVLAYIDEQFEHVPAEARVVGFRLRGGTAFTLDAALARRLVADLGARMVRGYARLGGGYRLDCVLGLHDLHYVLAGSTDFERFLARARGEEEDVARAPRPVARLSARVIDQGLGGYRLMWEGGSTQNARVRIGELIGLALPDDEASSEWLVGRVRWIRIDERGAVDAGVQLLARRGLPAGVRDAAHGEDRAVMRGVLLASMQGGVEAGYDALLASIELGREAGEVDLVLPEDDGGMPAPARSLRVDGLRFSGETPAYRRFELPVSTDPVSGR